MFPPNIRQVTLLHMLNLSKAFIAMSLSALWCKIFQQTSYHYPSRKIFHKFTNKASDISTCHYQLHMEQTYNHQSPSDGMVITYCETRIYLCTNLRFQSLLYSVSMIKVCLPFFCLIATEQHASILLIASIWKLALTFMKNTDKHITTTPSLFISQPFSYWLPTLRNCVHY